LRKFWGLLINEYVKIFSRAATLIMLALLVLAGVGYNFIVSQEARMYTHSVEDEVWSDYDQWIADEKTNKDEGWQLRVEQYEFERDSQIPHETSQNYRYAAINAAFDIKAQLQSGYLAERGVDLKAAEQLMKDFLSLSRGGDVKTFWQLKIKLLDLNVYDETKPELDAERWRIDTILALDLDVWGEDWRARVAEQAANVRATLIVPEEGAKITKETAQKIQNQQDAIALLEYRLENNIPVCLEESRFHELMPSGAEDGSYWSALKDSTLILIFVGLLVILVAGVSVSQEFSQGTVKFLLLQPVKRGKIFAAKYVSILTVGLLMVALYFVVNAVSAGLFLGGFGDIGAPYLHFVDGKIVESSAFIPVIKEYLIGTVSIAVYATLAFAVSTLLRNTALAVLISGALLGGGTVSQDFFWSGHPDWGRYLIFFNVDLNTIARGESVFFQHTVPFALCVIAVYLLVFLLTAWDGFTRRDVK
jgi:ABC-2 type transport system permease protein